MQEYLMLLLMQLTLFSSITAGVIILVKQVFKWVIPPKVGLIMWVILLVRLAIPILPESSASVYNWVPMGRNITYSLTQEVDSEIETRKASNNPYVIKREGLTEEPSEFNGYHLYRSESEVFTLGEMFAETASPNKLKSEIKPTAEVIDTVILTVYISGVFISMTIYLIKYFKARRRALYTSIPCTDENILKAYRRIAGIVGFSEKNMPELRYGSSSKLVGCFSPVVVFMEREGADINEISMVFAHELNHAKHRDNFVLFFSSLVTCFFWFNPLIWIVRQRLRGDVEIMCDSRTLDDCGILRTEYAKMLYRCSVYEADPSLALAGCGFAFGGMSTKNRMKSIARNLENKTWPRIFSSILCIALIFVCLTNPVTSQNIPYSAYIGNYSALTGDSKTIMNLTTRVSVSDYIREVYILFTENYGPETASKLGNGNIGEFKRLVKTNRRISEDVRAEIDNLISDQALTNGNCALINQCIISLLSEKQIPDFVVPYSQIVPKVIPAEYMKKVLEKLSERDRKILEDSYNLGVKGAEVKLSKFYTEAMYELILSRLSNEMNRRLFESCHVRFDVNLANRKTLERVLGISYDDISGEKCIYVIANDLTEREYETIESIIGAASAGQREDVYYLKETLENGYSSSMIDLAFKRAGYTVDDMLNGYAVCGYAQYMYYDAETYSVLNQHDLDSLDIRIAKRNFLFGDYFEKLDGTDYYQVIDVENDVYLAALDYLNKIMYVKTADAEEDSLTISGIVPQVTRNAVMEMYEYGLVETTDGVVDANQTLNCGQSLYIAYKLLASAVNVY